MSDRETLRKGDKGEDVAELQRDLALAGYVVEGGDDGDFGSKTQAAVLLFQLDRPEIPDTGIADDQTRDTLKAVIAERPPAPPAHPVELIPASAETMAAFLGTFIKMIIGNVFYGPGRGLWVDGKLMITYGAGKLGGTVADWNNRLGKVYNSLHCTSLTNVFLTWLYRYNQYFTHAGNIPQLPELMSNNSNLHQIKGGGVYRGFSEHVTRIPPDGSGAARRKFPSSVKAALDMRELYDRRASMPTFVVWEMSTRLADGSYLLWHHTGVLVFWEGRMFRLAADGRRDAATGYSAAPVHYTEITEANLPSYDAYAFHAWGCDTFDGSYGPPDRPIAEIALEH